MIDNTNRRQAGRLTFKVGVDVANVVACRRLLGQFEELHDCHQKLRPDVCVRRHQLGGLRQQPSHADGANLPLRFARDLLDVFQNPICHHLKKALLDAVETKAVQKRENVQPDQWSENTRAVLCCAHLSKCVMTKEPSRCAAKKHTNSSIPCVNLIGAGRGDGKVRN